MASIQRSIYLLNAHSLWATFRHNWTQCIVGNSLLLQRYVGKGINAKNPAIFNFKALSCGLCSFKAFDDLNVPEVKNRFWFRNRKIEIWKLASEFQFLFFVKIGKSFFWGIENWNLMLNFNFRFFWNLKIENWKLKCIFPFQFSRKTVGTRVHALLPIDFDETSMFVQ